MLNRIQKMLVGIGITLFLFACSSPTTEKDIPTSTHSLFTQPTTTSIATPALPSPTSSIISDPTEALPLESSPESVTIEPSLVPSFMPTAIPTEPLNKTVSCENIPVNNSNPLSGVGNILYYSHDTVGVGAISLADFSQRQIFESLEGPASGATLSPERNRIAFHRFGEDVILFNLLTGTTMPISINESWTLAAPSWSLDGRIIAHTTGSDPLKFYLIDPQTLDVEERIRPPGWPDVAYMTTNNLPGSGFLAIDPTETYAVYTELGINTDYKVNFVLRNIQDGSELWRNVDVGHEYYNVPGWYAEPKWNETGSQVILVLPQTANRAYTLISSLTNDGQEIEIARLTKLPNAEDVFQIRYLEWSSDQKFIHFGLFETVETGPGYILDTSSQTIYEICEPNFVQGWWLPAEEGGHLLYIAGEDNGMQTLNLLDITTWQSQQLLVTDNNFRARNVIGWTSIDTP